MRSLLLSLIVLVAACRSNPIQDGQLVHHVTIQLDSASLVDEAISMCRRLVEVPGVVALEVGRPAKELQTADRLQPWQIALVVVFKDRAAHDRYQAHPLHVELLERFGPHFKSVDVRDWWIRR